MRSTKPFCQDQSDYGSMISTPNDDITSTSPLNPLIPTNRQRWTSIIIVLVLQLLLVIQNSIYWNTLWPFMRTIDPSTDQTFYGTTLMLGSLATTLASPLLGYWSNRMQQCRLPVIFGVTVSIFGNLLIAMCESFSGDQKYVIMVGRLIAGVGLGSFGPCFGYLVMASTVDERRKVVSWRASTNSMAKMLGPAVSSIFLPLGFPGIVSGIFHLDMYTSISWACVVTGLLELMVLVFFFKEYWFEDSGSTSTTLAPYDKLALFVCYWVRFVFLYCMVYERSMGTNYTMLMFNWSAKDAILYNSIIQVCASIVDLTGNLIMGNIVLKYIQERYVMLLGLAISLLYFVINFPYAGSALVPDLTRQLAVNRSSNDSIAPSFYFNIKTENQYLTGSNLEKQENVLPSVVPGFAESIRDDTNTMKIEDNTNTNAAETSHGPDFTLMYHNIQISAVSNKVLMSSLKHMQIEPTEGLTDDEHIISNLSRQNGAFVSVSRASTSALTQHNQQIAINEDPLQACDYAWCSYTPRVQFWQYLLGRFCMVISLSVAFTPNATLFSKVVGPRKQGTVQGFFSASGQLAQTVGPIVTGATFQYFGPRVAFVIGFAVQSTGLVAVLLTFSRLVGWGENRHSRKLTASENDENHPLISKDYSQDSTTISA